MVQEHRGLVEILRLLVTVKTYPQPSVRHQEIVCTAGITEGGSWVRLYPVPFRYWDEKQQYQLYDWVELRARRRPAHRDLRKESYQPAGDVRVLGHVGTEANWAERKRLILPYARTSVEELLDGYVCDGESLGIIRPKEVRDVVVERESREWSVGQKAALTQKRLWGRQPRTLEKVPFRFSYVFRCDDTRCCGHKMQITDWGLSYLFLKLRRDKGEASAVGKTEQKCWELVADDRDAYLYVGTVYPYRSCIVIGMFHPKKEPADSQRRLPLR